MLRAVKLERQQAETLKLLHMQSTTDPLTGLANRRYFLDQSELEIKKATRNGLPLSLIMIDLDRFKRINDNYGHQAGDHILQESALLLKNVCRETDLVSRFGGEEFLVLLPATDQEGAFILAEKIRSAFQGKTFRIQERHVRITASLGVSQWRSKERNTDGALKRADIALYAAKISGRNAVKCAPVNLRRIVAR
jgi:diguanylate cyclase (GGDEF)-like protein